MKLQASMAQAAAAEARDIAINVEDRMKSFEADLLQRADVQKMIDEAIAGLKAATAGTLLGSIPLAHATVTNTSQTDKMSRTAVVGGFGPDTPKDQVIEYLKKHIVKDVAGIEEAYAYSFGNVGFVRFSSIDALFQFLKKMNSKDKPQINGRSVWISTSKSPEERTKSKHLSKFKRVLLDTGLAEADSVKIDYKRGIVFVKGVRVAEWKTNAHEDKLVINDVLLKQAGIKVEASKLYDAHAELLQM
jgi:hypothetical protein